MAGSDEVTVSAGGYEEAAWSGPDLRGVVVDGKYKVLGVLGEGGFGIVYEAEQERPMRRRVALKVIKPGMDSKTVVARFGAERQALAVMDHPNIARVLDGGATEQGYPYFVMELVRGIPITEFCDTHTLGIRERVELFRAVCDAVQHAHSKGVIHRDIKPSNVLVEYEGGKATVKVIDFGVAKAIDQRLSEQTIFTERGQLIGTPEYMSPEQAEMSGLDIDTRTDVYSLGVVLYELLTGVTPFDRQTLRRAAFGEIQRIIREEDPPRASTRLSSLRESGSAEEVERITKRRRVREAELAEALRRDLDWVLLRCLEKDRERRYSTAEALREELERYLADEPVEAGPPSLFRRGRRRLIVLLHSKRSIALCALMIGMAVTGSILHWREYMINMWSEVSTFILGYESTFDEEITRIVVRELESGIQASGAASGHCVVINPENGNILAIVDIERDTDAQGANLGVRTGVGGYCTVSSFEPDSALKPVVWCIITENQRSTVFGERRAGVRKTEYGRQINDVVSRYEADWATALEVSSNVVLTEAADSISPETMRDGLLRFGIGQPPMNGAVGAGALADADVWSDYTHTSVAMGFEVGVTLLQLARAYIPLARTGEDAGSIPLLRTRRPVIEVRGHIELKPSIESWIAQMAREVLVEVEASRNERFDSAGSCLEFGQSGNAVSVDRGNSDCHYAHYVGVGGQAGSRVIVAVLLRDISDDLVRKRLHYGSHTAKPVVEKVFDAICK